MTHTCLKSPFLPLSEHTTTGEGEVTACNSYERKTAEMAQKPGFALRWHITIRAERYGSGWCLNVKAHLLDANDKILDADNFLCNSSWTERQ